MNKIHIQSELEQTSHCLCGCDLTLHCSMMQTSRKPRTCFTIVQKAQTLDLLDEFNAMQIASLKIKKKKGEELVVFHQQKDIADHYGVGKSTISNLSWLSDESKHNIRQEHAAILKNNLDQNRARLQVSELFSCFRLIVDISLNCFSFVSRVHSQLRFGIVFVAEQDGGCWGPCSVALLKEKAKTIAGKVVEEYKDCGAYT